MTRRTRRWLSIAVLAMLAFSQASIVLAACAMERAGLAEVLAEPTAHDCCDQSAAPHGGDVMPMSANACLTHSTSDLQVTGSLVPIAVAASDVPVLFLPPHEATSTVPRLGAPPRAIVPPRILLHSFLI
jgi:hypothetical protein